jgi:hypothetical protein
MSQIGLILPRQMRPVTHEELARTRSFHAAVRATMDASGMQDKSISIETEIDPAQLSKIASGQAGIQPGPLSALMRVCGSHLPLFYLNWFEGFDPLTMRQRESELERQLREEREKRQEAEKRLEVVTALFKGRA